MKTCNGCKHSEWKRTDAGRLHPSGDGKCRYPYRLPPLPAGQRFVACPLVVAVTINRRRELPAHCVYWSRA